MEIGGYIAYFGEDDGEYYMSAENYAQATDTEIGAKMQKFRKKPAVIEAVRLMEPETPESIAKWCGGKVYGIGYVGAKRWVEIETLKGVMKANYGDWIIKGIKGEFYPCKNDIFVSTYEEVV